MATALIFGQLSDVRADLLSSPELWFTPNVTSTDGLGIFSIKPVKALIVGNQWEVPLEVTTNLRPAGDVYYTLRIISLDPDHVGPEKVYIYLDFPGWQIYVPEGGGTLGELVNAAILSTQFWNTPDGVEPPGSRSGDLIFNRSNNFFGQIA